MPKMAASLSAIEIRRLSRPGFHAVGEVPGLLIRVTPTGAKQWVLRVRVGARRRAIGLGGFPAVGLAEARDKARELRAKLAEGVDPLEERRAARAALLASQAQALTLRRAVERYIAVKGREFASDKHRRQWAAEIDRLVGEALGERQVAEIALRDVLAALEPHWHVRTDTAKRVRQRLERVFDWATVAGHRSGPNPAAWRGGLAELLPSPSKVAKAQHHPAVPLTDLPAWFAALRKRAGMAARALEFLTLTAARSGEVRGAAWAEVDTAAGVWTVPAERMKAGRAHRVPLSTEAMAILEALPRFGDVLFPAPRGGQLSDMTISAVMRRMHAAELEAGRPGWVDSRSGRPAVPHGLRSCFRDWAAEAGIDHTVAELALAHRVGSEVERAYRRSDLFERRQSVMASWAAFLAGQASAVIRLRG